MVDWVGLSFPIVYAGILFGSLYAFSYVYRQRQAQKAASLDPWFPPHTPRNIYLSLLHYEPSEQGEKAIKVPDSILKAALLRRATEDIHRLIQTRNAKQALNTLLQKGCIGEDLWQRYLRAEKEIEEELRDVVVEANAFADNWGATIFQTANEMAQNHLIRKRVAEVQSQVVAEKEWWDQRKSSIQTEFMKELDGDAGAGAKVAAAAKPLTNGAGSEDEPVLVEGGGPKDQQGGGSKKKKKGKQ